MQSLGEHLKADTALAGIEVNYGLPQPIPDVDSIDLRYGGSPQIDLHDGDEGTARIWVDVTKKLAAADAETAHATGVAYAQLYDLVNRVADSLRAWWTTTDVSGLAAFKTEVEEIQSDGDELRDYGVAGSRIVININWREAE